MKGRFAPFALGGLLILVVIAWWLRSESHGDLSCHRIALTDMMSGHAIQGAEDMALDPTGPRLLISAYDRRKNEGGGLYAVPLAALLDPAAQSVAAERLLPRPGQPPLRPHGFGVGPVRSATALLVAIERQNRREGRAKVRLQPYRLSRTVLAPAGPPWADPLLCNANDLVVKADEELLVTTDRAACDAAGRMVEDVLGLARGKILSVSRYGIHILASGLHFANGIAADDRHVFVATTRDPALLVYDRPGESEPLGTARRIALDAAPDNLAWGDDGLLYVAAHVSLLRYALFRLGLSRESASAIYRYDPILGRPPTRLGLAGGPGAVSGATVALAVRDHLVLGAAYDGGLSICAGGGAEHK